MSLKNIIIGIDGGDLEILRRLSLPTFERIFSEGVARSLPSESFTRGWSTILTGQGAGEHGGMFNRPELKGYLTTVIYGGKDFAKNPALRPLWKELNERGLSVGFLNVPTTFPAPEVDGFFISGAGGGRSLSWPEMGRPESVRGVLEAGEYVPDIRLDSSAYDSFQRFLGDLARMTQLRGRQFSRLLQHYRPDFGFVCFVGPDRVQHALFRNLEALLDEHAPAPPLAQELKAYYRELDAAVAELMADFPGANFVLVSDHGHAAYRRTINLNQLLEQGAFIERRPPGAASSRAAVLKAARRLIPLKALRWIRNRSPQLSSQLASPAYKLNASRCFALSMTNGVFLNERGRFPEGQVQPEESAKVVQEVIDLFAGASTPEFPLAARPYRSLHRDSFFADFLPDVVVDFPEDAFPAQNPPLAFLTDNPRYQMYGDQLPAQLSPILSGIHRSSSLFAAVGPDVDQATEAFQDWTLEEFYSFVLRLL